MFHSSVIKPEAYIKSFFCEIIDKSRNQKSESYEISSPSEVQ